MAPHHLAPRAELTATAYTLIICLVIIVVCGLFCVVVLFFVLKRKRALKARNRDLAAEQRQPFVTNEYRAPIDNRGDMGMGYHGPIELQGNTNGSGIDGKPQQLDSYAVPTTATYDGGPVELGAGR